MQQFFIYFFVSEVDEILAKLANDFFFVVVGYKLGSRMMNILHDKIFNSVSLGDMAQCLYHLGFYIMPRDVAYCWYNKCRCMTLLKALVWHDQLCMTNVEVYQKSPIIIVVRFEKWSKKPLGFEAMSMIL